MSSSGAWFASPNAENGAVLIVLWCVIILVGRTAIRGGVQARNVR